ncbi:MAG: NrtA/SsuA/CpmA family ABC transporter substrate-binding protein [Myxococcota bacterium]|nr:NrtA/SsuA/CpmA family ABC transporter substrate-binding protein [Myxococcota bacterium]
MRPLLLLTLLATSSCVTPPPPPEFLRLGVVAIPAHALMFVAQDHRLFAARGLDVEVLPFSSGRDALRVALEGGLDVATVYPTPIAVEALAGAPVAVIATTGRVEGLTGVLLHPRLGRVTAASLRGRSIGVTPATSSQLYAELLVAQEGLETGEVNWVLGNPPELLARLESGSIDGASLWAPNLSVARRRLGPGSTVLTTSAYTELGALAGERGNLKRKSEAVRRLLLALRDAEAKVEADPSVALLSLTTRLPEMEPDELRAVLTHGRFEVSLSNLLLAALRLEATWLERSGTPAKEGVRMRSVLLEEPLSAVAPEVVTLLHSSNARRERSP